MQATVFLSFIVIKWKSPIQKYSNCSSYRGVWHEDDRHCVIELQFRKSNISTSSVCNDNSEKIIEFSGWKFVITHLDFVWRGPDTEYMWCSLKYCGKENPRKRENPNMKFVLKLFKLQNWRNPRPADAAIQPTDQMSTTTTTYPT